MESLSSLLGSLPSASLASADLARFLAKALRRRSPTELSFIRETLARQTLSSYPPTLGPAMSVFIEQCQAQHVDPAELDAGRAERILWGRHFIREIQERASVHRQPLRPGEMLTHTLRDLIGEHVRPLPGFGPQLGLVSPVEVLRLEGLGWTCMQNPVIARPMLASEGDQMRQTWASIEEYFGWQTEAAFGWEARFVAISSRVNHDINGVMGVLKKLTPEKQQTLWGLLVSHLRDQELNETHRPGRRGLERALETGGYDVDGDDLSSLLGMATHAYESCAIDLEVARGVCPCTQADIDAFRSRIEIPVAARDRLADITPAEVQHSLRVLADVEDGRIDLDFESGLRRDVRTLRDQHLRLRYKRRADVLTGIRPIRLARALKDAGHDRAVILDELRTLDTEARRDGARIAAKLIPAPEPRRAPKEPTSPDMAIAALPRINPFGDSAGVAAAGPSESDPFSVPPMSMPPMPRPPRSSRSFSSRQIKLPPMPDVGNAQPAVQRRPLRTHDRRITGQHGDQPASSRPGIPPGRPAPARRRRLTSRSRAATEQPTTPPVALPTPVEMAPAPAVAPLPQRSAAPPTASPAELAARPARGGTRPRRQGEATNRMPRRSDAPRKPARAGSIPAHLITPQQAGSFYEAAFRELQVLERDLLERGPWQAAEERLHSLRDEAQRLNEALGPSARSGDQDFRAALHRVGLVQSYLERVMPLLDGTPKRSTGDTDAQPERGVLGRLGRLWKKDSFD